MKDNKIHSSKTMTRIYKIADAAAADKLVLNSYESQTLGSIADQIKRGRSTTPSQQQFIDNLYKQAVKSMSLRVRLF
jgi:hypothetical protein